MRVLRMLIFLLACASPAMADSIFDVTGVLTVIGNNVCNGTPCVETLRFSFDVALNQIVPGFFSAQILPSSDVNSLGPLGNFSLSSSIVGAPDHITFLDGPGDQISINFLNTFTTV